MVRTLQELCLVAIRDSIEQGQCPPIDHLLPLLLRESIFEKILTHGTINNRECIDVLGSHEYLHGFTRIDTQKIRINDADFLQRAAESIGRVDPGTKTSIGDGIVRLDLNIYDEMNHADAVRLISKCTNLRSLNIDLYAGDRSTVHPSLTFLSIERGLDVLNRSADNDACRSILENVSELSIGVPRCQQYQQPFHVAIRRDSPLLEFRALTSLKLKSCKVDIIAWLNLMETTRHTLENLSVIYVIVIDDRGADGPTPVIHDWHNFRYIFDSMPRLRNFECRGPLPNIVPESLLDCGALERVHLRIATNHVLLTENLLEKLSSIQQQVTSLDISVRLGGEKNAIVERFFDQFGPNVKWLDMYHGDLDLYTTAIERCTTLERLKNDATEISGRYLFDLFRDPERAEKLRKLRLNGFYDRFVLDALFENCRNLHELTIIGCSELIDQHLIDCAVRCNTLTRLHIIDCPNVGDDGLTAVLIARGSDMEEFSVRKRSAKVTDKTWMTMFDRCPNIATSQRFSKRLEELRREKSFHRFVDVYQSH